MKKLLVLLCLDFISTNVQAQDSTDRCGTADMDTTEFVQLQVRPIFGSITNV